MTITNRLLRKCRLKHSLHGELPLSNLGSLILLFPQQCSSVILLLIPINRLHPSLRKLALGSLKALRKEYSISISLSCSLVVFPPVVQIPPRNTILLHLIDRGSFCKPKFVPAGVGHKLVMGVGKSRSRSTHLSAFRLAPPCSPTTTFFTHVARYICH